MRCGEVTLRDEQTCSAIDGEEEENGRSCFRKRPGEISLNLVISRPSTFLWARSVVADQSLKRSPPILLKPPLLLTYYIFRVDQNLGLTSGFTAENQSNGAETAKFGIPRAA